MNKSGSRGVGAPDISVEQVSASREAAESRWRIVWRIENRGGEQLEISAGSLPHGKFRSEERRYQPPLELGAGESVTVEHRVQCREPAGSVIENAFLILSAARHHEAWRIFVRFRVTVNARGEPASATELITTQRVGFSAGA